MPIGPIRSTRTSSPASSRPRAWPRRRPTARPSASSSSRPRAARRSWPASIRGTWFVQAPLAPGRLRRPLRGLGPEARRLERGRGRRDDRHDLHRPGRGRGRARHLLGRGLRSRGGPRGPGPAARRHPLGLHAARLSGRLRRAEKAPPARGPRPPRPLVKRGTARIRVSFVKSRSAPRSRSQYILGVTNSMGPILIKARSSWSPVTKRVASPASAAATRTLSLGSRTGRSVSPAGSASGTLSPTRSRASETIPSGTPSFSLKTFPDLANKVR
ncbi:MAG: hypothetical protein MZV63_13570 [Marinilabiliales bacterium]|nr:hypothetical protein [Marinilabiliales bacterium]